jgi:lysophospholipase L1-like esterase
LPPVKPPRIALAALLALLSLLVAVPVASAAKHGPKKPLAPTAKVRVEKAALGLTPSGGPALLVAVRYPIQMAGRRVELKASIGGLRLATSEALAAGELRRPERRRAFTFVHEIDLKPSQGRALETDLQGGRHPRVKIAAQGTVDIDEDGRPDFGASVSPRTLPLGWPLGSAGAHPIPVAARPGGGKKPFCASVPVVGIAPGTSAEVPLPACTFGVEWKVATGPSGGSALVDGDHLDVTAPAAPGATGTTTVKLNHATVVLKVVAGASAAPLLSLTKPGPVVRAMGDSVTAGYGYYSDGSSMEIWNLPECKVVGHELDDACSSNSTATKSGLKEVPYAPDYGLSNNISWAAQWANEYGVTNYKNFAISGSEPTNWAPGGDDYGTTKQIESENPDYILLTIGANPILADTLFGFEAMACAIEADVLGDYRSCVEEAFEGVHLRTELKRLYTNLVENTTATIYVMQYHLSVPSSALAYTATQIAETAKLMNETIAEVAAEVGSSRLQVITPPHFPVGVDLEPVYPSHYSCSSFGYKVDGPSVQSTPSQVELAIDHPLSFCKGPINGPPWVISGDTGIHPSATGYAQMASQVPAPTP